MNRLARVQTGDDEDASFEEGPIEAGLAFWCPLSTSLGARGKAAGKLGLADWRSLAVAA